MLTSRKTESPLMAGWPVYVVYTGFGTIFIVFCIQSIEVLDGSLAWTFRLTPVMKKFRE